MKLRNLEIKDASLMFEWMHDLDVVQFLGTNFSNKTLNDCLQFIEKSLIDKSNIHKAIVSDEDEYMGTVSLKHVDYDNGNAEFAITVRKAAMGKGYSWFGMLEIIKYAFKVMHLQSVYWCVSEKNLRACRFYDKHGFHRILDVSPEILERYNDLKDLRWYSILSGDDFENKVVKSDNIAGCNIINIKTIPTVNAGELSFFEGTIDIPFEIKRIYYISKVPEGIRRGFHAHKKLKQLLFCPYGRIQLIIDNGSFREEITLCDPSIGVIIDKPVWREMLWLKKDSVLCVVASDYYSEDDYIRNYNDFLKYLREKI